MNSSNAFHIERIKYNNNWFFGEKFLFKSEETLNKRLGKLKFKQIIRPVEFNKVDLEVNESTSLCFILEMLDNLPLRPDHGFDTIWKPLDSYSDILKKEYSEKNNGIEYKEAKIKLIFNSIHAEPSCKNGFNIFIEMMSSIIPLTTCKFISKRICEHYIDYENQEDKNIRSPANTFKTRLTSCINNENFFKEFFQTFFSDLEDENKPTADMLRKSGRFIQKLIRGEDVKINNIKYKINNLENFFSLVLCTQYRNERAHGNASPPFRRSTAKLTTYSTPYFLMIYSYYSLIFLLWSRHKNIFLEKNINESIDETIDSFKIIFKSDN